MLTPVNRCFAQSVRCEANRRCIRPISFHEECRVPLDETGGRPGRRPSRNVFGGPLDVCSARPLTGFFRNGCCDTGPEDVGSHTVCVVMTKEFLAFSKQA